MTKCEQVIIVVSLKQNYNIQRTGVHIHSFAGCVENITQYMVLVYYSHNEFQEVNVQH